MELSKDKPGKNKISAQELSLPKGGGAMKGLEDSFQPNVFTGTGAYSIPISVTPARGFEPKLTLSYSSGNGNSAFGLGCSLSLSKISVSTAAGIPQYHSNAVYELEDVGQLLIKEMTDNPRKETFNSRSYTVTIYIPRILNNYTLIEQWKEDATGISFWKTISADNVIRFYGQTEQSCISNPDNPQQIFQWLIDESQDGKGNKNIFGYKSENSDNVPATIYEQNRTVTANRYIHKIQYGNYLDASQKEQFAFELIFDYGEYDLADPAKAYTPTKNWACRPDPYSAYNSGFEIRTFRLCLNVLLFHHFPSLQATPLLVKCTKLEYLHHQAYGNIELQCMSMLNKVTLTGYRQDDNGTFSTTSQPTTELRYSAFNPPIAPEFKVLTMGEGFTIPGDLSNVEYLPVDLYGDGLPGFLYSNEETSFYLAPLGEGKYADPEYCRQFPVNRNLQGGTASLVDIDGDGQLEMLINNPPDAGFYDCNNDGTWDNFSTFCQYPNVASTPLMEAVGINNNGKTDLLQANSNYINIFLSEGKTGYKPLRTVPNTNGIPAKTSASQEMVTFTGIFGDGLSHRVRIRSGIVECWPNLGYGVYGKKVLMGNAPLFNDNFSSDRLYLADIAGTGTTDLIYLFPDRIEVYLNQNGNTFADPIIVQLPALYDAMDQVSFADVLGNGTTCLVFTKIAPAPIHYYYNFAGEIALFGNATAKTMKPFLLNEVDNNMGCITQLHYCSSTKFALEDKLAGKPWVTKLRFPVQVVESTVTIDFITNTRYSSAYKYHDGYYNPVERRFCGFGYVESWDTETFEDFTSNQLFPEQFNPGLFVSPVYTKQWFLTGVFEGYQANMAYYKRQFFHGDKAAYNFPDSVLQLGTYSNDAEIVRQAYLALSGQLLRREVYGADDNTEAGTPYTVEESNVTVALVQPAGTQRFAVFTVHPRESIAYNYERNANDPRMQQRFTLLMDDMSGQVKEEATIYLPRRSNIPGAFPDQLTLKATGAQYQYIDTAENQTYRWRGLLCEQQQFELFGLTPDVNSKYFSYEAAKLQVGDAFTNVVPYEGALHPQQKEARQLTWNQVYFWNEDQSAVLPFGQISAHGLSHHLQSAAFTQAFIDTAFTNHLTPTILADDGGYYYDTANSYWWNRGLVQYYYDNTQSGHFHMPYKTENSFAASSSSLFQKVTLDYDTPYVFMPIVQKEYLDDTTINQQTCEIDYQVMQYRQVIDINNNVSQAIYDPLGLVAVTSTFGKEAGQYTGGMRLYAYDNKPAEYVNRFTGFSGGLITFDDVLAYKDYYLQGATNYFFYSLHTWKPSEGDPQPINAIHLVRDQYYYVNDTTTPFACQTAIQYEDGMGRDIARKLLVDKDTNADQWMVSGRTVYNNKGEPCEQYFPFFSDSPYYEALNGIALAPPTSTYYDPLMRVTRVDTPKGFFTKTTRTAWEEQYYDEDDTVLDAPFYKNNYPDKVSPAEKLALEKAAVFFDTPTVTVSSNTGNTCMEIQTLTGGTQLLTHVIKDMQGRVVESVDPRLYQSNQQQGTHYYNFRYLYAMEAEKPLNTNSADAGVTQELLNIFDKRLWGWNSRNYCQFTTYDRLQRPIHLLVKKLDGNGPVTSFDDFSLAEIWTYGETRPDSYNYNLRGQLYQLNDLSGIVINSSYTMTAQIMHYSRQVVQDYKLPVNWKNQVPLQPEVYVQQNAYNALQLVITGTSPDDTLTTNTYNKAALLKGVDLKFKDNNTQVIISNITYDANSQRTAVAYGNGTTTNFRYEDTTQRLMEQKTTKQGTAKAAAKAKPRAKSGVTDSNLLMDIGYTYDPVGNITQTNDTSVEIVFNNNQVVDPIANFTYDAIYRLIEASGRQHIGISGNTYKNNKVDNSFKQSIFSQLPSANDLVKLENYRELYAYDDSNNLIKKQHIASTSYNVDTPVLPDCNRLSGIEYDEAGNMRQLEINTMVPLSYNCCNNLVKAGVITRPDQLDDADYYLYDASEIRTLKVNETFAHGGTVTNISQKIYLGSYEVKREYSVGGNGDPVLTVERQTLRVMDAGNCAAIIHYWVTDTGQQDAQAAGERSIRFQLGNNIGSVAMERDAAAALISYEEYFPYGGTGIVAGSSEKEVDPKDYRYNDKECDDSTGLYYYGARYYISWLGRWNKPDPEGTVDGLNLYTYVGNNPLIYYDPTGTSFLSSLTGSSKPSGRTRLFLGESDFTYALAFANKHPEVAHTMVATTYETEEQLEDVDFYKNMLKNKLELELMGVQVLHGVDATNFDTWTGTEAAGIEQIYFSHPHTQSRTYHTSNVLKGLFHEARTYLNEDVKIHIPRVWNRRKQKEVESMYGFSKVLDQGPEKGSWMLQKKHKFSSTRYPGYKHTMTKGGGSADVTKHGSMEFVFKRKGKDEAYVGYKKRKMDVVSDNESEDESDTPPPPAPNVEFLKQFLNTQFKFI